VGRAVALAFFVLAASWNASFAADITIMAEDAAPPFSHRDGTGFANDLVKAAFRAAGIDVALDIVPYARCKKDTQDGRIAGCFGMSWYNGVEKFVAFSDRPIFRVHADVFLLRGATTIRGPEYLSGPKVVGIVNEYEYPDEVYNLRKKGVVLQAANDDLTNLRLLARGRLDAAIVMTNDLVPQLQKAMQAGVAPQVVPAFRLGFEDAYVGFSLKHPQGEAARRGFNEGYRRILADGTVEALRRKWVAP
jgi:polar amino acid transport system substrate-binding protein